MRTFISTGRNKQLSRIDNSSILAGGYRWSKQAAYIELPNIKGGDHSHCYCLYVLPKGKNECYLVCYIAELGRFEQACRNDSDAEQLLSSSPFLKQLAQATEAKDYNTCFLLKVKDFSHKGLSTKHLCIATVLKTPYSEKELFESFNKELYDKITLVVSTANNYLEEENKVSKCLSDRDGSQFRRRKLKRIVRIALIGIIGFNLLDVLDNDIEAMDMGDDYGSIDDAIDDGDFDSFSDTDYDDFDSPDYSIIEDDAQGDIELDGDSAEISDGLEVQTNEHITEHRRYRDISFTGWLNCLECGCGSYVPGEGNYCKNCHHSFFSHRR